jgi:hypothetical protein
MFVSSSRSRARGGSNLLRRLARVSLAVLRALVVGAASLGPPRRPPEPPAPQTTEQVADQRSSEA